jgi:hypothetical protein
MINNWMGYGSRKTGESKRKTENNERMLGPRVHHALERLKQHRRASKPQRSVVDDQHGRDSEGSHVPLSREARDILLLSRSWTNNWPNLTHHRRMTKVSWAGNFYFSQAREDVRLGKHTFGVISDAFFYFVNFGREHIEVREPIVIPESNHHIVVLMRQNTHINKISKS